MITIVDYGVGNIGALLNMFDYLAIDACATSDPSRIASASKLLLPGVGAFDKAMSTLRARGLVIPLNEAVVDRQVPVLGVCLGMQIFARKSDEGNEAGLGWIPADVVRIAVPEGSGLKVPHIGWTEVVPSRKSALFDADGVRARFYFDHSYHVVCDDAADIAATFEYGAPICCAVSHANVCGVQFHPEKSHRFGMRLLRAFSAIPGGTRGSS